MITITRMGIPMKTIIHTDMTILTGMIIPTAMNMTAGRCTIMPMPMGMSTAIPMN